MRLDYESFHELLGFNESDNLLVGNIFAMPEERAKSCKIILQEIDLEHLDYETFNLMPLFFDKNKDIVMSDDIRNRLKDIYKYNLFKNSGNLSGVIPLLQALNQKEIPVMLMKGMALVHLYYKNVGQRMMGDVDIAVPIHRFDEALTIAKQQGFDGFPAVHSWDLHKGQTAFVDLHKTIFKESYQRPEVEDVLWQQAHKASFYGREVYFMCEEHFLVFIMANAFSDVINHGKNFEEKNKKWLIDLQIILQHKPNFDLEKFTSLCYKMKVMPQVICMLMSYRKICSSKFGEYDISHVVNTLEQQQDFNKQRMQLFAKIIGTGKSRRLAYRQQLSYLYFLYLSVDAPAEGHARLQAFKKFVYDKYDAKDFLDYLKKHFKKKH